MAATAGLVPDRQALAAMLVLVRAKREQVLAKPERHNLGQRQLELERFGLSMKNFISNCKCGRLGRTIEQSSTWLTRLACRAGSARSTGLTRCAWTAGVTSWALWTLGS